MNKIDKKAKIGKGNKFGQNIVIGKNVIIGNNNFFGNNVVIEGRVEIGSNNYFSDFAAIGRPSQHRTIKFEFQKLQKGKIKIGNKNVFREFVTVHMPIKNLTKIGDNCFIMAYNHISHDTHISSNTTLANNCQIGGFTFIGRNSNIGLSTTIHQLSSIGAFCIIGMQSNITMDIPPGMLAYGNPINSVKIDKTGLLKKGFNLNDIEEITQFYESSTTKLEAKQNIDKITSKLFCEGFLEFISNSKRKILLPNKRSWHIEN